MSRIQLDKQSIQTIKQHGWEGVLALFCVRSDDPEDAIMEIPRIMIKDPMSDECFNSGTIDRLTDELGSFRKGADKIFRANVSQNSMHIREYEDKGIYHVEVDAYNPNSGLPEAVNHLVQDVVLA